MFKESCLQIVKKTKGTSKNLENDFESGSDNLFDIAHVDAMERMKTGDYKVFLKKPGCLVDKSWRTKTKNLNKND